MSAAERTSEAGGPAAGPSPRERPLLGAILPGPAAAAKVAGVPVAARAALLLRRAGCQRVVYLARPGLPDLPDLGPRAAWVERAEALPDTDEPVVLVCGDWAFDRAAIDELLARARPAGAASLGDALRAGSSRDLRAALAASPSTDAGAPAAARPAAASERAAATREPLAAAPAGAPGLPVGGPGTHLLLPAGTAAERTRATRAILRATGKAVDGPLTRLFERRISQAISGFLLPWPVSPNAVTTVSLAIGLSGAALLATTEFWPRVGGATLFLFATIVDGCDGEIARAKLLESPFGKLYDTGVDIAVNLAVFAGLGVGVWREFLGIPDVLRATVLLVTGGVLSMAVVETIRRVVPERGGQGLIGRVNAWAERFATLEWSYLVLAGALLGQLPFFFWGAAIGANVFAATYLFLGVIAWRRG